MKTFNIMKTFGFMLTLACLTQACHDKDEDVKPAEETTPDVAADMTLSAGAPVVINLLQTSGVTADDVTITITEEPAKGSYEIIQSVLLKYTPADDFTEGEDAIEYSICDNDTEDCTDARVDFTYTAASVCEPHTEPDIDTTYINVQTFGILVLDNDESCQQTWDVSTLTIVQQPSHGEATAGDGQLFYAPTGEDQGTVQIIYSVMTKENPDMLRYGVALVTVEEEKTEEPEEPEVIFKANDITFYYEYLEFKTAVNLGLGHIYLEEEDVFANDELGELTYEDINIISVNSTTTQGGTVVSAFGVFSYTPPEGYNGEDSFTYQICHGTTCDDAVVTIAVPQFPNPEPAPTNQYVAYDDTFTYTSEEFKAALYNNQLQIDFRDVVGNDDFGGIPFNTLTYGVVNQPQHGDASYSQFELFIYYPGEGENFVGTDSFPYQICDGDGENCVQATITITVTE